MTRVPDEPASTTRHYAGILVVLDPARFETGVAALASLPGFEVHHQEPSTGRVLVVQEASRADDLESGVRRLQGCDGVLRVHPVVHYRDDDPGDATDRNLEGFDPRS